MKDKIIIQEDESGYRYWNLTENTLSQKFAFKRDLIAARKAGLLYWVKTIFPKEEMNG